MSETSGELRAAAARGSRSVNGNVSFVTSSDWTTTCTGSSSGSTSYTIAAIERCVNETIRVDETLTRRPVGETHSASRRSTPARRSSTRSCLRNSP